MRLFSFLLTLSALVVSADPAAAQINIGPYTFPDETPFADSAIHTGGSPTWWGGATNADEAVAGYTPTTAIVNMGNGSPETVELVFSDVLIRNDAGTDLVIFDARFSADDYEVAVQPVGGTMTSYIAIRTADQVATGVTGPPSATLWGVEVDLSDYGLGPGAIVDRVFVKGDAATNPEGSPELDLVMAAAVNGGGCMNDVECDDMNDCTVDACALMICGSTPEPAGTLCAGGVCNGDLVAPGCVECIDDTNCASPTPRCDLVENVCVACLEAADCDDDNECTEDACDETMACTATALPAGTDCTDGVCNGDMAMPLCIECSSNADCDEFAPLCVMSRCVACTAHEDCDDRDECTDDRCDIDGQCVFQPLGTPECLAEPDAGTTPDAGTAGDAGIVTPPGGTGRRDGGCGCDVPGRPIGGGLPLVVFGIAALAVIRLRLRR